MRLVLAPSSPSISFGSSITMRFDKQDGSDGDDESSDGEGGLRVRLHPQFTPDNVGANKKKGHGKVGRKEDEVWDNFEKFSDGTARCRHCDIPPFRQLKRTCDRHLAVCSRTKGGASTVRNAHSTPLVATPSDSNSGSNSKRQRLGSMDAFVVRDLSREEQELFEELLADWMFAVGEPFGRVSHPLMLKALQVLRPNVRLPDRHRVGGVLLHRAYEKSVVKVNEAMGKSGK